MRELRFQLTPHEACRIEKSALATPTLVAGNGLAASPCLLDHGVEKLDIHSVRDTGAALTLITLCVAFAFLLELALSHKSRLTPHSLIPFQQGAGT